MYRNYFFLLAGLLLFSTCQIPIENYEQVDKKQFLLFDVEITPRYAKGLVTRTSPDLQGNARVQFPTVGISEMYVTDSNGTRFNLPLDGKADSTFRGVEGETYRFVAIIQGKKYESKPEKMPVVVPIDSIFYRFNSRNDLLENNLLKHGFDVYAKFKDPVGRGQFYYWRWVNYTKRFRCGTRTLRGTLYNVLCDTDCWDINPGTEINLFSDRVTDGATPSVLLTRVPFFIPPDNYYFHTDQCAITENVYNYLISARDQTQTNGGQFDVPAQTQFSTNISSVSDPDEQVLGVFNVFSYDSQLIYVDRSIRPPDIDPKRNDEIGRPPYQCNPVFPPPCVLPCPESKFSTAKRPPGWRG
jgi:hypothetical protein